MTAQWSGQGLPPVAQSRLDEIKASGTWGSALTTDEFAAIKSGGFDPVGQVLGAAVYNMGYQGTYGCPSGMRFGSYNRVQPRWQPGYTSLSSERGALYAPMVQTMYAARRKAISRMVEECAALGGHGVVGVRLTIRRFQAGSSALEFNAIGTAVRAAGAPPLRRPFTSDLSGQDFAKLIADGVVPVGLVLGISIGVRHDDWMTRSQTRWTAGNTEVGGYTELVSMTRHDARNELQQDVLRHGAEGVVIQSMDLRVGERECQAQEGARDHIAEATIIGTAIVHFTKSAHGAERPSLAILSLDPERRQAARRSVNRGISN
ncbi:MAG TPA: heavy metal-binding domain-containing protein [Streptosporangiaceae bacterium]|nr:heavy metal-binding domain-containing protein [Streptosporangiaceae bacterium]